MRIGRRIPKATDTQSAYAIYFLSHCNNSYTNGAQYYVIHTLPDLFNLPKKIYCIYVCTIQHFIYLRSQYLYYATHTEIF